MSTVDLSEAFERLLSREQRPFHPTDQYTVAHLHIPKCAGMSFQEALKAHLQPKIHLHWENAAREWKETQKPPARNFRLVTGHIRFQELFFNLTMMRRPIYPITVVREPIARLVSMYNYGRSSKYPRAKELYAAAPTLNDYCRQQVSNEQSQFAAGVDRHAINLFTTINRFYLGIATMEYADNYLNRVLKAVGATEEPVEMPQINEFTTTMFGEPATADDLDPEVAEEFRKRSLLDFELFEAVQKGCEEYFAD